MLQVPNVRFLHGSNVLQGRYVGHYIIIFVKWGNFSLVLEVLVDKNCSGDGDKHENGRNDTINDVLALAGAGWSLRIFGRN
jgi:hypothetical protein